MFAQNEDARLVALYPGTATNAVAGTPAVETCAGRDDIHSSRCRWHHKKSFSTLYSSRLGFSWKCDDVARHVYGTAASYCFQSMAVDVPLVVVSEP